MKTLFILLVLSCAARGAQSFEIVRTDARGDYALQVDCLPPGQRCLLRESRDGTPLRFTVADYAALAPAFDRFFRAARVGVAREDATGNLMAWEIRSADGERRAGCFTRGRLPTKGDESLTTPLLALEARITELLDRR